MCMRTPHDTGKLQGQWQDPSGVVDFDYDCPETTFDPAASAFDEFFDYAIKFDPKGQLKKVGLKYDQCIQSSDCPETINENPACCVETVLKEG